MGRWRLVAGVGVVAVLALTLIVLSVRGDTSSNPPPTTLVAVPSPTTTTSTPTTGATTVTTTAEQRLVEVEVLLQELWFGWFDAIYRKDPDALWQVVATTRSHNAGVAAMESMEFTDVPASNLIDIGDLSILLDRPDCLVVEHFLDMSSFRGFVGNTTVRVLWPDGEGQFRFATAWQHANDLWLGDCDDLVRDVTP